MEIISLIKESFESWYNNNFSPDSPVSIAINYSDVQKFAIKCIHTVTMEVREIGIKNGESYTRPILCIQENYNHGNISDIEEKEKMAKKLLMQMYGFQK